MTVWLNRSGWDIATWELKQSPDGVATVYLAGSWHPLDVSGTLASIPIAGPDYVPDELDPDAPAINDVVVIPTDELGVVNVGGVHRTDEWIRLRG